MKIPDIKIDQIIRIGENIWGPKAQIIRIYTEEEKVDGLCGDIEVVYWQNKIKGIKEDAVWDGQYWRFKVDGPGGSYININHYDPTLKR